MQVTTVSKSDLFDCNQYSFKMKDDTIHFSLKTSFQYFCHILKTNKDFVNICRWKGEQKRAYSYLWKKKLSDSCNKACKNKFKEKLIPLTSEKKNEVIQIFKTYKNNTNKKVEITNTNIDNYIKKLQYINIQKNKFVYYKNDDINLNIGELVDAKFKTSKAWFRCSVVKINKDKTVHLKYNDGDVWTRAPLSLIRKLNGEICGQPILCKIINITLDSNKPEIILSKCGLTNEIITCQLHDWINNINSLRVCFLDNNNWYEIDHTISRYILDCFIHKKVANYSFNGFRYELKWTNSKFGCQVNLNTGTKRKIALFDIKKLQQTTPVLDTKAYPLVPFDDIPDRYKNHLLILKIPKSKLRIYNLEPILDQKKMLQFILQRESKSYDNDTHVLFHGTDIKTAKSLIQTKQGFQKSIAKNGSAYGDGIYLTSDILYARSYATQNKKNQQLIFMCDVFVGNKMDTNSSTSMLKPGYRCGGSLQKQYSHIFMKPWVYVNDINICYAIEINY